MLVFEELELFELEPFELLDSLDEPLEDWLPEFDAAPLPDSSAFFGGALRFIRRGLLGLRLSFLLGLQRFSLLLQLGQTSSFGSSLGIALVRGGLGHDLLSFGLLGFGIGNSLDLFVFFSCSNRRGRR